MIVSQPIDKLWAVLNNKLGVAWSSDLRCIGLVKEDCVVAVAGYNAWVGRTCCFHGAIDDPAKIDRTYIRAIFEYPFVTCKLTHMFAPVSEANPRSVSFCARSGFKQIHRLKSAGFDGEDILLLELRPDECRWLKDNHGQEQRSAAGTRLRGGGEAAGRLRAAEHDLADVG